MAQNQAARIDGQSVRIFSESREIPAIAVFGFRTHSRRKREIKRARGGNVRKSAKMRRDWGEWSQNQAGRVCGQSVRIFMKSREIPTNAGFGFRTHSRCKREIKRGAAIMYESRRKLGASWAKVPRVRRPGSTAHRLGSSGGLEKSQRSQVSVSARILSGRERLSVGRVGNVRNSANPRREWGE